MGKETISPYFHQVTAGEIASLTASRPGEQKLGEKVLLPDAINWLASIQESPAKFVLIGIPEDIGVRANLGVGGAHTLWQPALKALLNVQHTPRLQGHWIMIGGSFNFDDWMQQSQTATVEELRAFTAKIDEEVCPVIAAITAAGKIPIIIGGGHNNAYPLLKGTSIGREQPINCINLDAHSDYRVQEGRHSGNGFRYARAEGYLDKYAIVGLHQNYNSAAVIADLDTDSNIHYSWYEDIFIHQKLSFTAALEQALAHTSTAPTGIELDMDCIAGVLSSAVTPSGISSLHARQYLDYCGSYTNATYLHLTEGSTTLRDGRTDNTTGKLTAYLVTDFIKAVMQKRS